MQRHATITVTAPSGEVTGEFTIVADGAPWGTQLLRLMEHNGDLLNAIQDALEA